MKLLILTGVALISSVYSAPQFISFKEGSLGVNFGGYHAGVGLGGLLGGGTAGGLFAEAGTPHGQAARAGLGGAVGSSGHTGGGLYAGATAGGNVQASAGLAGETGVSKSVGGGYAAAQAGNHVASSNLGGETAAVGSTGFSFSGSKSIGFNNDFVKEVEVQPPVQHIEVVKTYQPVQQVEVVKTVQPIQHLESETAAVGSTGFSFSGSKSFGFNNGFVKEVEVQPPVQQIQVVKTIQPVQHVEVVKTVQPIQHVEVAKPVQKEIHAEVNVDVANEVEPVPLGKTEFVKSVDIVQPTVTVYKEVSKHKRRTSIFNFKTTYHEPIDFTDIFRSLFRKPESPILGQDYLSSEVYVPRPVVKHIHHVHHVRPHHVHKTAYIGGYVGDFVPPPPATVKVVQHTVQAPVIQKRIDVAAESSAGVGVETAVQGGGQVGYTKSISYQRNPTFFADIFNIPIQTLRAVGNFLGNTAGSTNISVQKTASVHADADGISSKHAPVSSSSAIASTDTKLVVDTPPVSKVIDDIFAIPINTLGAVNKFLENNVPARKRVQVTEEDSPVRVKLGPKARRRANRQPVIIVEESNEKDNSN